MPENNFHRGGGKIPAGTHLQYHNVYGFLMVKASREESWMSVGKTSFHFNTIQFPRRSTICRNMDRGQWFQLGTSENVRTYVVDFGLVRTTI